MISNQNIIYTCQGLTDDGKYWVAVIFPIRNPVLPMDNDTLPEGYTAESLIQNYGTYVSNVKEVLESQLSDSFVPTINLLDGLVSSITLKWGFLVISNKVLPLFL